MPTFNFTGIINVLNRVVEKLGALNISIGGDQNDYNFSGYQTAAQTLVSTVDAKIKIDTKRSDPTNAFDTTNNRFTIPISGWYTIKANLRITMGAAAGYSTVTAYKNGVRIKNSALQWNATASKIVDNLISFTDYFEKGDYLELWGYVDGANATITVGEGYTYLSIAKINKFSGGGLTQNPHKFKVFKDTAQTLSAGSFTKISFNKKDYDPSNLFDNTTNYRFIAAVSGWYQLNARVSFMHASLNTAILSIMKNGAEYARGNDIRIATTANLGIVVTDCIYLNKGDYVEIQAYANCAAVLDVFQSQCYFSGHLLSQ